MTKTAIGSLTALALICTGLITAFRHAFDAYERIPKVCYSLASMAIGIGLAYGGNVTLGEMVPAIHFTHWLSTLLAGTVVGVGGSAWHDILSGFSSFSVSATPRGLKLRPKAAGHPSDAGIPDRSAAVQP
jgi:hypothetical protein